MAHRNLGTHFDLRGRFGPGVLLLVLALLSFGVSRTFSDLFQYDSYGPRLSIAFIPITAALMSVFSPLGWTRVMISVAATFLFFPRVEISAGLLFIALLFFVLSGGRAFGGAADRLERRHLPLALSIGIAYTPVIVFLLGLRLSPGEIFFLILVKSLLAVRLISWAVDRTVYRRHRHHGIREFLEYIYCPVFMLLPGQIQYVQYSYFHSVKDSEARWNERAFHLREAWRILTLSLWGLGLMVVFGWGKAFFRETLYYLPVDKTPAVWAGIQLFLGFVALVLVYTLQAGGMAFQVAVGRALGYDLKYDMHWPLLARSPIDYLRRHSSYVRDYVVHVGMRPLGLALLRKGISPAWTIWISSVLSYSVLVGLQVGYRSTTRSVTTGLLMIAFLAISVSLPTVGSLRDEVKAKPFRSWNLKDYLAWGGTLIVLSLYKAALGLFR